PWRPEQPPRFGGGRRRHQLVLRRTQPQAPNRLLPVVGRIPRRHVRRAGAPRHRPHPRARAALLLAPARVHPRKTLYDAPVHVAPREHPPARRRRRLGRPPPLAILRRRDRHADDGGAPRRRLRLVALPRPDRRCARRSARRDRSRPPHRRAQQTPPHLRRRRTATFPRREPPPRAGIGREAPRPRARHPTRTRRPFPLGSRPRRAPRRRPPRPR